MRLRSASKQKPDDLDKKVYLDNGLNGSFLDSPVTSTIKGRRCNSILKKQSSNKRTNSVDVSSPDFSDDVENNEMESAKKKLRVRFEEDSKLEAVKLFANENCSSFDKTNFELINSVESPKINGENQIELIAQNEIMEVEQKENLTTKIETLVQKEENVEQKTNLLSEDSQKKVENSISDIVTEKMEDLLNNLEKLEPEKFEEEEFHIEQSNESFILMENIKQKVIDKMEIIDNEEILPKEEISAKEEILETQEVLTKEDILVEEKTLSEEETLPERETLPEEEIAEKEDEILAKEETLPEEEIAEKEDEVLAKEEILIKEEIAEEEEVLENNEKTLFVEQNMISDKLEDTLEKNQETVIEEEFDESDEEIETINEASTSNDPFVKHVELQLEDEDFREIKSLPKQSKQITLLELGVCKYMHKELKIPVEFDVKSDLTMESAFIKKRLQDNIKQINNGKLEKLTQEIVKVSSTYKDLLFTEETLENSEQIRLAYCIHVMNHVLKTRSRIIRHNFKLNKGASQSEFRDQGFTRPKVLIVLPFRNSAFKVVDLLIKLFIGNKKSKNKEAPNPSKNDKRKLHKKSKSHQEEEEDEEEKEEEFELDNKEEEEDDGIDKHKMVIMNYKKFKREFYSDEKPTSLKKPDDYKQLFEGNTNEVFRLGIEFTKKSFKLYSKFYSSDIIIASPLGLRTIIGAEGEKKRDYDFLSSIELLVLDQTHLYLMQNWEHVIHLMQHMNLQPRESHDTDFSRIRMWSLEGLSKFYRQTLIFGGVRNLYISSIFERECHNFEGKLVQSNLIDMQKAAMSKVLIKSEQKFYRFSSQSLAESSDARFKFFVEKVLPKYNSSSIGHTLVYVASYFDYLRLRNYMRKQEISFTHICEHTEKNKMALSRKRFFMNKRTLMLYTERAHFYNRYRIKGIQHLVFYQPPTIPNFFAELCNLMHETNQRMDFVDNGNVFDCIVLYDRFDAPALNQLVGHEKTQKMLSSFLSIQTFNTNV